MKKCPSCKLLNIDEAVKCDCGHAFGSSAVHQKSLTNRFNDLSTLNKAILTAGVLLGCFIAIALAASINMPDRQSTSQMTAPASQNQQDDLIVTAISEPANGWTNDTVLTPANLAFLEESVRSKLALRSNEYFKSEGITDVNIGNSEIRSASWVLDAEGERYGIIDIQVDPIRLKKVLHLRGDVLTHVNCLSRSGQNLPLSYGPCGAKIEEMFGVQLPAGK